MDIYEFAMKMELDGKKHYTELMEIADNNGVKVLFNILAQEEQAHYDILKSLQNKIELGYESKVLDMAKNVFEMMFEGSDQVKTMLSGDALVHALKLENESIAFYKEKMIASTDELEKKTFKKLMVEEKKHYFLIENLYDHISGGLIRGIESAEFQQMDDEELE
ncbi:MAG: ferritin family protein [Clostridia bacterium]|nr:ferritin family protein [Clostridia bacterium]